MTIARSDLKFVKSATVTDTSANGGRMSYIEVLNRTKYNLFPRVTKPERMSGITRYRKEFVWNANSSNETAFDVLAYLTLPSLAGDAFRIAAGTQTDIQNNIDSTYKWYGSGHLSSSVNAGDNTISIDFEDTNVNLENGIMLAINSHILLNEDINSTVKPLDQVHWNESQWVSQTAPSIEAEDVYPYGTCLELLGGNKANIFSYSNNGHLEYHYIDTTVSTENMTPAPDGSTTIFTLTCPNHPIKAGEVHVQYTIGTFVYDAYDNGSGVITGTNITTGSTVDYETGVMSITFSTAPDNWSDIVVEYQKNNVSWTGNTVVVKLADTLLNNYTTANTIIGMCLSLGDLEPTKEPISENLSGGTFEEDKIVLANKGTIEQRWTLTFLDGSNYTCVGDTVGSVGQGVYTGLFAPINPDQGSPYLEIPSTCWVNLNAVAGNTVVFDTHPSSFGIWWREYVPSSTSAYSNNITLLELYVE